MQPASKVKSPSRLTLFSLAIHTIDFIYRIQNRSIHLQSGEIGVQLRTGDEGVLWAIGKRRGRSESFSVQPTDPPGL